MINVKHNDDQQKAELDQRVEFVLTNSSYDESPCDILLKNLAQQKKLNLFMIYGVTHSSDKCHDFYPIYILQSIIFCNSTQRVELLAKKITELGKRIQKVKMSHYVSKH